MKYYKHATRYSVMVYKIEDNNNVIMFETWKDKDTGEIREAVFENHGVDYGLLSVVNLHSEPISAKEYNELKKEALDWAKKVL